MLNAIEMNLKKDGVGIIDFFNINKVRNVLVESEVIVKKDIKFKIKRRVNKNFVSKNITFEDNHIKYSFNENVNALSLNEFKEYFSKTNLEIQEVFGDYNLNNFNYSSSQRLMILFKKKSQTNKWLGFEEGGDILSQQMAVPSALLGLTSLFEMGRGEP